MIGLIVWAIILIVIAWCLTPWWFMPLILIGGFVWALLCPPKY